MSRNSLKNRVDAILVVYFTIHFYIMITIKKIINPKFYLLKLMRFTAVLWSDKMYIKMFYLISMGRWPNLKNPQTFQEKLNWLKLNYRIDNQY